MSEIFEIIATSQKSRARVGKLKLPRGVVNTPVFMPIGTRGSVKGLTNFELETLGSEIILGNTYHLWLRPGLDVINHAGGLHDFNSWRRPILTDSGGFQAFSLSKIRKFSEQGVTFKSQLDGSQKFLSPEISMHIQTILGSDIALVLDECLEAEVSYDKAKDAMWRTRRWAERSQKEFERLRQIQSHQNLLFGIPQGAQFADLRKQSAELTMELNFPGYSIGGVANGGEPEEIMYSQVFAQTEILENSKPKHLLGVGRPKDLVQMVARGIDMFDCVYPTRNARHGSLIYELDDHTYVTHNLSSERFAKDLEPINSNSIFPELRYYSKAYLRHLYKAGEILASRLGTLHNLEFYINLMSKIRAKIADGTFDNWWEKYDELKISRS